MLQRETQKVVARDFEAYQASNQFSKAWDSSRLTLGGSPAGTLGLLAQTTLSNTGQPATAYSGAQLMALQARQNVQ